ncbi:hypothetical protein RUND412_007503 [Rhizina undulata]
MRKYETQVELEKSGECDRILETAISSMANIRAITTGYGFDFCVEFANWRKTLNHRDRTISYLWSKHEFFSLVAIDEREGARINLINTTHCLGLKLDRLDFRIPCCWLRGRLGIFHSNSELWHCAPLLESLTSLTICIAEPVFVDDVEAIKIMLKEETLCKFLSFTPNLRKLSLEVESIEENGEKHILLTGSDFKFPLISILDILRRHGNTLDCLYLQSPTLLNGTWRELLDFLKQRLNITDLVIMSPWEILLDGDPRFRSYNSGAQLRMQDYVLHGDSPFPPTEQELEENGWDMSTYLNHFGEESEEVEDEPEVGEQEPEVREEESEVGEDEPEIKEEEPEEEDDEPEDEVDESKEEVDELEEEGMIQRRKRIRIEIKQRMHRAIKRTRV